MILFQSKTSAFPLVVEFKKTESQNISILTEYFAGDIKNLKKI